LAFHRGDEAAERCTDRELLGALMEAEFQGAVIELVRAYFKVHAKTPK